MLVSNSLPNSLTDCCLVNLIDVTLACEDSNSELLDIVNIADDDRVGNSLLQIWYFEEEFDQDLCLNLWYDPNKLLWYYQA